MIEFRVIKNILIGGAVLLLSGTGNSGFGQNPTTYSEPVLLKQSEPHFSSPVDLALSLDGGYLLVADTGNNEIKILQPGTLKLLSQFGKNHLEAPQYIAFEADGVLRVADRGNSRVISYEFKGVYRDGSPNVKKLTSQMTPTAALARPGTATDPSGQSYEVDGEGNQILIFDRNRKPIGSYGAGVLQKPKAVETVGRYFWIADTGNNRILLLKAPRAHKQ